MIMSRLILLWLHFVPWIIVYALLDDKSNTARLYMNIQVI